MGRKKDFVIITGKSFVEINKDNVVVGIVTLQATKIFDANDKSRTGTMVCFHFSFLFLNYCYTQ